MNASKLIKTTLLGAVSTLWLASSSPAIEFEKVQLSDQFYSEGGTYGDYNADGNGDVVVGPWIYYGPDFESKHRFYEGEAIDPAGYSKNFLMFTDDVNSDDRPDILVIGFPGAESWWYENPGKDADSLWKQHVILDSVDNESPIIADIDGDGVKDLVCCNGGHYIYASHAGRDATQPWAVTKISTNNGYQRFTHGLGVGDVNNDGRQDLLGNEGWWENPGKKLSAGETWAFHPVAFSNAAAQMYAVDFDGDGKNEVLTSVHAHGFGLVYFKATNEDATEFERVEIMGEAEQDSALGIAISQLHGVDVADVNRDGITDIVTGKRWWAHKNKDPGNDLPATLVWFETRRMGGRVAFVPHIVDVGSGVGTQVTAGDVNGDGLIDIVCGIKRGAYLFLQKPPAQAGPMVPGLATKDPFGQRVAYQAVSNEDRLMPAIDGRLLDFGFEHLAEHKDWEVRGPIAVASFHQDGENTYFATHPAQPKAVGEAISRPFLIPSATLIFVGGGNPDAVARVEVVLTESGKVAASWPSEQNAKTSGTIELDLGAFVGRPARIRIIDHSEKGFVRVDDFHFKQ